MRSGRSLSVPSSTGARLGMALFLVIAALISYFSLSQYNEVTGETQRISLSPQQEIALGLQAAPEMIAQHGGEHPNAEAQATVDRIGMRIVAQSAAKNSPYEYEFHLLADDQTINAFALPGGQVFITQALLNRLETEGQLAGVLGHEIGHVVGRHSAEHIAKAQLTEGLTGAAVLATYDPDNPNSQGGAQIALLIGKLVNMRFGRNDELESDALGVRFLAESGYDPRAMIRVMEILAEASEGQAKPPEFFNTHPNPQNRIARIETAIKRAFPNGVPEGLIK
ncbi:MAG: M48 family metalloprotease [Ardenticatenales bacterium]|nr:M48 family metalloprotease [Ardenticatenales bacterium]